MTEVWVPKGSELLWYPHKARQAEGETGSGTLKCRNIVLILSWPIAVTEVDFPVRQYIDLPARYRFFATKAVTFFSEYSYLFFLTNNWKKGEGQIQDMRQIINYTLFAV